MTTWETSFRKKPSGKVTIRETTVNQPKTRFSSLGMGKSGVGGHYVATSSC